MERILRILAVDNEPSVTTSLRYVFPRPRYEMTTVASGHDALAKLEAGSDQFDAIIVDQKMPNLTGVELVSAMRKRGVTSKIIVLSAHLLPDARAAYEEMDVHVMLTKPFDIAELRAAADGIAA
jgi:DNA-binding response OmpR family regulator